MIIKKTLTLAKQISLDLVWVIVSAAECRRVVRRLDQNRTSATWTCSFHCCWKRCRMTWLQTSRPFQYCRQSLARCVSSRSGQRPPWTSGQIQDRTQQYGSLCRRSLRRQRLNDCTTPERTGGSSRTTGTRQFHTLYVHYMYISFKHSNTSILVQRNK